MLGSYLGTEDCYRTLNRIFVGSLRRKQLPYVCSQKSDRPNPRFSVAAYGPSHVATSNSIQWSYRAFGRTGALSLSQLPPAYT